MHIMQTVIGTIAGIYMVACSSSGNTPPCPTCPPCPPTPASQESILADTGADYDIRNGPLRSMEIIDLLRLRRFHRTDTFDGAIRFLARFGCGYREDHKEETWVDQAPIEQLFATAELDDAMLANACGELILNDHSSRCGALPLSRGICTPRGKPNKSGRP